MSHIYIRGVHFLFFLNIIVKKNPVMCESYFCQRELETECFLLLKEHIMRNIVFPLLFFLQIQKGKP